MPKTIDKKTSFVWSKVRRRGILEHGIISFSSKCFIDSYFCKTDTMKKLIFLSIATWVELTQEKVVSSLGANVLNKSVMPSISANLEAGKRSGLYKKSGLRRFAHFSFSDDVMKSPKMAGIYFWPSSQAINIARTRARKNKVLSKSS